MPFSWGSLLLTEVMGSWTHPPLSPPPPRLSGPSSLLIRMPERVAQTALTFCLLPLVSSQHSSQRAFWKCNSSRDILFTASPLLHGENWRPSCDPQGLTCWSLPPSAASSAALFLLTQAPCHFLKLFCCGWFSVLSSPMSVHPPGQTSLPLESPLLSLKSG